MKVIWYPKAKDGRQQVAAYILKTFGKKTMEEFKQRVRDMIKSLKINPYFVNKDPLFEGRKREYRSVFVNNLSRMVYFVEKDIIYIADFWDGRRNPDTQAAQIQED
jgi:plasmid stabilization system protein ParE